VSIEIPVQQPGGKGGRERIVPVLIQIATALASIEARLAALEARPPATHVRIREWKPDHRRLVDGGTQVRKQRRKAKALSTEIGIRRVGR
jgi:hypothetical protein